MPTASETIADWLDRIELADVPSQYIENIKTLLLDYLGVAIRGSRTTSGRIVADFVIEKGGAPEASLVADPSRSVPAYHAAFANAVASHSIELDDVDVLALFHFSPPVFSAALAAAQANHSSGSELLLALAVGCEVMARVSNASNPSLRNRGFHTTPSAGVFGAAVAAGMLEGLSRDQMVSALALAGAQSSGLMEMYGPSMQKRFNPGPAARNGIVAAQLAGRGFTGAASIFEGDNGWLGAFSDGSDVGELTRDLGSIWNLTFEYKPYSSARPIHNGVDAALGVRSKIGSDRIGDVVALHADRHPDWAHYHLNPTPETYHEAQVSLPFSIAVALTDGDALLEQYDELHLRDPEVGRLSRLLTTSADASLPRGVSLKLTATLADGSVVTTQTDSPRGSTANPMSVDEMRNKFTMLTAPVIGDLASARLVELVAAVGDLESVDTVFDAIGEGISV